MRWGHLEYHALLLLAENYPEGIFPKNLAGATGISRYNASLALSRYCRAGLLRRGRRRKPGGYLYTLTPLGVSRLNELRKVYSEDARIPLKSVRKLSDLGYGAGLIDGEGTIEIGKSKGRHGEVAPQYQLSVKVTNTDKRILTFLKTTFGGSVMLEQPAG